jgi:hypothetical protein
MANFSTQLIVDIVDANLVVQASIPQDTEDEESIAQIQESISGLSPLETSEKLADKQKKNQLTAETIISRVDIPNISKNLTEIDLEINKKQGEINRINGLIDPIVESLTNNIENLDMSSVVIIEKLNTIRAALNLELNTLRLTRVKITDKYYKLRQSVKEPTINIAQFNLANTQTLLDKFKIIKK